MRQREKEERKRKKRNINPKRKKTRASPSPPNEGSSYMRKKIDPQREGNNQTKQINPTKLQTHLNIPEPHGYIKNAALARCTRLYPLRRKNPQLSPLKVHVPE
jgi:hypothetical protein